MSEGEDDEGRGGGDGQPSKWQMIKAVIGGLFSREPPEPAEPIEFPEAEIEPSDMSRAFIFKQNDPDFRKQMHDEVWRSIKKRHQGRVPLLDDPDQVRMLNFDSVVDADGDEVGNVDHALRGNDASITQASSANAVNASVLRAAPTIPQPIISAAGPIAPRMSHATAGQSASAVAARASLTSPHDAPISVPPPAPGFAPTSAFRSARHSVASHPRATDHLGSVTSAQMGPVGVAGMPSGQPNHLAPLAPSRPPAFGDPHGLPAMGHIMRSHEGSKAMKEGPVLSHILILASSVVIVVVAMSIAICGSWWFFANNNRAEQQ